MERFFDCMEISDSNKVKLVVLKFKRGRSLDQEIQDLEQVKKVTKTEISTC